MSAPVPTSPHASRTRGSRLLHRLGQFAESTMASTAAAVVSAAFLMLAVWAPRATPWLTAFQSLAAAVTLVMVFALQRKLDEILRVLPGADPRLVRVEEATDDELTQLGQDHLQLRHSALSSDDPAG